MLKCYPQKPSVVNVNSRLRALPSVESLLQLESFRLLAAEFGRTEVVFAVRETLAEIRDAIQSDATPEEDDWTARVGDRVRERLLLVTASSLEPVVNATGIIVHTNLGRAPLSEAALAALQAVARGYSNLEYDLERGARGHRDAHAKSLLARIFPGRDALAVNNNAAAVLLALNTFALGREVLISRGELVEIGGSFRVPEILERSGARLREVGTTNKTRLSDYEKAFSRETGLILRVHPSNFHIVGFTERATTAELAAFAQARGVPLVEDFGSGNLLALSDAGLPGEPTVQASLAAGVDLVTFSGDKLLGGPQAGILVGERERIEACKKNPLARALRVDKLTYAALEATLSAFVRGKPFEEIPVLRMLSASASTIEARARRFVDSLADVPGLELSVVPGVSKVGGGAAPEAELPTFLVAVACRSLSAQALERALRAHNPPVIARIQEGRVLLDLRTVAPFEEDAVLSALRGAV